MAKLTKRQKAFAEKIEAENAEYNKREGLSGMLSGITGGSHTPTKTARQKDGSFKPVLGSVHIDVWWKEGMALPKYTFMADFNDNAAYKEQGCGIEGWLWRHPRAGSKLAESVAEGSTSSTWDVVGVGFG